MSARPCTLPAVFLVWKAQHTPQDSACEGGRAGRGCGRHVLTGQGTRVSADGSDPISTQHQSISTRSGSWEPHSGCDRHRDTEQLDRQMSSPPQWEQNDWVQWGTPKEALRSTG